MSYSSEVLADSPHAYWKLDETSGTTAADSSGNSHPMTYTNGVALATINTGIGNAVTFDGVNDYAVTAVTADTWNFTNWTLECLVKFPVQPPLDNPHPLMTVSYASGDLTMALGFDLDGPGAGHQTKLQVGFFRNTAPTGWKVATWTTTPANGTWYHLAGMWDGTTLTLYVNGVVAATNAPGTSYTGPSTAPDFRLARRWDSGISDQYANVTMEHAAVYPSALSSTRIANHYGQTPMLDTGTATDAMTGVRAVTLTDSAAAFDQLVNESGTYFSQVWADAPLSWFRLDDAPGSTSAADSSGHSHPLTSLLGSPTFGGQSAARYIDGTSVTLNGTTGALIDPTPTYLDAQPQFSVEYWFNTTLASQSPDGSGLYPVTVGRLNAGASGGWYIQHSVGSVLFFVGTTAGGTGNVQSTTSSTLNDGHWHHIAATYDGGTGELRLYVDGDLQATFTITSSTQRGPIGGTGIALTVGTLFNSSLSAYQFHYQGGLDEVAIYDRVLSQTRINEHFFTGTLNPRRVGAVSSVADQSGSTVLTFAQPATAGNLLIAGVCVLTGGSRTPSATQPSGWSTALAYQPGGIGVFGAMASSWVFYKVATGGETSVTIVTNGSGTDGCTAVGEEYTNVTPTVNAVSPGYEQLFGGSAISATVHTRAGDLVISLATGLWNFGATGISYQSYGFQNEASVAVGVSRTAFGRRYGFATEDVTYFVNYSNAGQILEQSTTAVTFAGIGYPSVQDAVTAVDNLTVTGVGTSLLDHGAFDETFVFFIPGGPTVGPDLDDVMGRTRVDVTVYVDGMPHVGLDIIDGATQILLTLSHASYPVLDPVDGSTQILMSLRATLQATLDPVDGATLVIFTNTAPIGTPPDLPPPVPIGGGGFFIIYQFIPVAVQLTGSLLVLPPLEVL